MSCKIRIFIDDILCKKSENFEIPSKVEIKRPNKQKKKAKKK